MTTLSSSSVLTFNVAQTFYIDPGIVENAPAISITSIGLYFRQKPNRTNNKSGIVAPGVDVFLCETKSNGTEEVPASDKFLYNAIARVEYDNINVSTDASLDTIFTFGFPINVNTGKSYSILIKFDGDEEFVVWKSVEGEKLVGTNSTAAGPAGKYIGKYFEFSYVAGLNNPIGNTSLNVSQTGDTTGSWKPLNSTDLKFDTYCAKYIPDLFANTSYVDPITGSVINTTAADRSYLLYKDPYEFFVYNKGSSTNADKIFGGEIIYQNNVVRPEILTVFAGSDQLTGTAVNFVDIFGNSTDNDRYLVVYDGTGKKNVRKIKTIQSNNSILVDIPLTFSSSNATFSKVVAGQVDIMSKISAFGNVENAIAINKSSANSSLRFVNNTIETVTVVAGGAGYSNSDYLLVFNGGVAGGNAEANAIASVSTNSTGGITSIKLTNKGIGFVTAPTLSFKAANGSASNGSSANVSVSIGSTLCTEFSNAALANATLINIPVNSVTAGVVDIENPYGTSYYFKQHYLYYSVSDGIVDVAIKSGGTNYVNNEAVTFTGTGGASGKVLTDSTGKIVDVLMVAGGSGYTVAPNVAVTTVGGTGASLSPIIGVIRNNVNSGENQRLISLFERHNLSYANTPLILSRSYEVTQSNVTITTVTGKTSNTNVSSVMEMVITSNNVYTTADILSGEVDVFYEKYAINNDATGENTGNGKAISKHISKVINFSDNKLAEDLIVYIDAYRPANTNFLVYARIYNSADNDAFVDKDWSLMEYRSNGTKYSSPIDQSDIVEYSFGFSAYPQSSLTSNGTITTQISNNVVTGSGTFFSTNFANNDVVKIYSPLFPQNYMISVVNSIASNTSLTLNNAIVNNNVVGSGLKIDKIAYKNQAFNNGLNDNTVRYYNNSLASFDGYNSFAVKIVFLSDNEFVVPKIDNIRAVGVTA